ncbi:MAG: ArsR/SmtB family transcription factor [Anaerolineae bacterium]
MSDWDFILAPATVDVQIVLDEVAIISNSFKLLRAEEFHDGLHEWIQTTAHKLSPQQAEMSKRIASYIDHFVVETQAKTYPEFIRAINDIAPERLYDFALQWMRDKEGYPGDETLLKDKTAYLDFLQQATAEKYARRGDSFNYEHWEKEWMILQNPQKFLEDTTIHLQFMWDTFLKAEWQRVKPILQEAVSAFESVDYSGMNAYDAIEAVTGRNMRGKEFFEQQLEKTERLIFMPNAHLGPYISWGNSPDERTMVFFFGARPPKNATIQSTALSRSELLVRLNALADETRLKILEMLTEHDELCAQDFINELDLSQSSASRHLRQLTASGYLNERRRDVAKCYSINPERLEDTIHALKVFLKKA